MYMTPEGLSLIKQFEGFRSRAYRCPAGVWTIGYGHTSAAGPPAVAAGMEISESAAAGILARDAEAFAAGVRKGLKRDINPAQFSALVSFAYNVGLGNFSRSSVLQAVNAGDLTAVPRRLQLWNKSGGKVLPGLVRRRAAEAELFLGGPADDVAVSRGTVTPPAGKPLSQSSSAAAAATTVLAGGAAVAAQGRLSLIAVVILLAVAMAAAAWIVRERWRMSKQEGV